MIDPTTEKLLRFTELAKHKVCPRSRGKRTHASTLFRWATTGSKGVRLETIRVSGRFYSTVEAMARFLIASTEASEAAAPVQPAQHRQSHRDAEKRARAAGF